MNRATRWIRAAAGLVLVLTAPALAAQGRVQARQQVAPGQSAERDSLEARVRVRMGQVLRNQLGLTDTQMRQLMAMNRRFEGQKQQLFLREREVRMGLRDELASGDTTRNAQVAVLLDRMLEVQRERMALLEAEQKELATFLTPIQRARYFGVEEQIRRRLEELRDEGARARDARLRQQPPPARRPPAAGVRRPPPA